MESEFIALELASQEVEWLRNTLADIPVWGKTYVPVSLHCDSQAAIGISKIIFYNGTRRHIRIKHAAVEQLLRNGVIWVDYVKSERNLADPFTKGLTRNMILDSSRGMGLKPCDQGKVWWTPSKVKRNHICPRNIFHLHNKIYFFVQP